MSSGDHLWSRQWNHEQLQMLMPAKQLIELPFFEPDRDVVEVPEEEWVDVHGGTHIDGGGYIPEEDDQFWDRKLDESYTYGYNHIRDAIKESGQVKVPVKLTIEDTNLGTMQRIRQGHHRIASANEVNPDMEVPIRYVEDRGQSIPNEPYRNE